MVPTLDDLVFRESAMAWLRVKLLTQQVFTREELAHFEFGGSEYRLISPYTGIWKPQKLNSALSISTAYVENESDRPYEDGIGADEMLRYKWRGDDPNHADNRGLREAMVTGVPLIWFLGVGYTTGTKTQVYEPVFPVWLILEEPEKKQFVVALDEAQRTLVVKGKVLVGEIERLYNQRVVKTRVHQPMFRTQVLHAYSRRCAVCRLPFEQLLEAAHIKADADGGAAHVSNGLALCKIHHGAFDAHILGIDPNYKVHISRVALDTTDGPTLQHSLKEMHGQTLGQLPTLDSQYPSRELLDERFEKFKKAS